MERTIKFRGKSKSIIPGKSNQWVYGDLIHDRYNEVFIQYITDTLPTGNGAPERKPISERHKVAVDPATVGQYTGLKDDKNDKEIYEGDVCRGKYGGQIYEGEVLFAEGGFSIRHNNDKYGCCAILNEHENIEIIGNAWDNPDLLKEES